MLKENSNQNSGNLFSERDGQRFLRQLTLQEMGIQPREVIITSDSFKIYGVNDTELIKSLKSLNGFSIVELEAGMKPRRLASTGFLKPDQSLLEVMATDNNTVIEAGLTHQQLADFLNYFERVRNYIDEKTGDFMLFEFAGKLFRHKVGYGRSSQNSPFRDGTESRTDHTLVRVEDNRTLEYGGLLPIMIDRYGFYEGKGISYRIEPLEVARLAGFIEEELDIVSQYENEQITGKDIPSVTPEELLRIRLGERVGQLTQGQIDFTAEEIINNQLYGFETRKIGEEENIVRYVVKNTETGKIEGIVKIDRTVYG